MIAHDGVEKPLTRSIKDAGSYARRIMLALGCNALGFMGARRKPDLGGYTEADPPRPAAQIAPFEVATLCRGKDACGRPKRVDPAIELRRRRDSGMNG
jgi:hypothetical protein